MPMLLEVVDGLATVGATWVATQRVNEWQESSWAFITKFEDAKWEGRGSNLEEAFVRSLVKINRDKEAPEFLARFASYILYEDYDATHSNSIQLTEEEEEEREAYAGLRAWATSGSGHCLSIANTWKNRRR